MNRRTSKSLRMQLFLSALFSLAVAIVVFFVVVFVGNLLVDKTLYSESYSEKVTYKQFSKLQEYVDEESVSMDNLQKLNSWCRRNKKVSLVLYNDDVLIYQFPFSNRENNDLSTRDSDPELENSDNEYALELYDGVKVRAFLYYYYTGDGFYFWVTVLSGFLAFVAFSVSFVLLLNKKISYINLLKDELDILSGGQLDYQVTVVGNDELGELALGIDQMRRSIIKHQETENQMRSANSELITAMSHDLRTPLTSLLAYLEIIERGKYVDQEQMNNLIHKSVNQTMRIKNMADKLFEYFLAYATEWEAADMENVDADNLFQQILGDYAYSLESNGMKVQTEFSPVNVQVSVNTGLLQRALDNLYSNLLKYADPKESILLSYEKKEQTVCISISNATRDDLGKNTGTSIGLITCRRIVEYHKGVFDVCEKDNKFEVTVCIPVQA